MVEANHISKNSAKPRREKRLARKISENYLSNSGAYYLERFPASVAQFRRVMSRKIGRSCLAHPAQKTETCLAMLEQVIEKFQRLGYLNDSVFARNLALSLKNRGWPHGRILSRLKEKGVPADIVADLFSDDYTSDDLHDALTWIKRKKMGGFALRDKAYDKQLASLARSGFSYQTAKAALDMKREDAELILEG